ncbi:MAG: 4-hydroxythreonine-4-phosphate dehydrogenase PdxA [Bacteroidetes bacterium]|jgi:4-hydroxythreonine-4-phosphate dehydrogenase|nr:4-hydroxythreonine-4-phosphate dehydrogenase PdxA [Bacteroidota bacterium]MBL0017101.1 4-hydroxythreonine-4-phosphate dehydrogenase PdxA [Bacteroidota bacterium]MBP6638756.1 4-hydroxythreonine-4-phosphate dehydrogenase PdxA [Bacteroidia bacterium]MBP6721130.1 4-hydroxythreonine-4-phosphate dehydrogenase PdxA [Bacteroidia bacterium]MBP8073549.1 4-hydroxythreonine-4-phosphate dehydrogenase PdxA [Bacteroidia bacterium]
MQKTRKVLRIGITIGDYNGIGPELIIQGLTEPRLREICTPIVYGSSKVLNVYRKLLSVDKFSYNVIQAPNQAQPKKVSVIDCITNADNVEPGKFSLDAGKGAFEALRQAVQDLKSGEIDALVTLPIDKSSIQSEEFQFPGHTEYLAQQFGQDTSLMFMIHDRLKVAVVTGHVPLANVSKAITVELILKKLRIMNMSLKTDFNVDKPKIAVLGLNPHAGDNGLLGKEEKERINKAVEDAQRERIFAMGPYSADGFFGMGLFKKFDAILAMYHDQGLIPFKLMAGFEGVNFTAGLPIVRTSPDHGVAYNLAGKGEADPSSFIHAVYKAMDICRERRDNLDLQEGSLFNPKARDRRHVPADLSGAAEEEEFVPSADDSVQD